jgi:hypothetical protein
VRRSAAQWSRWLTANGYDLRGVSMTEVDWFLTARRRAGCTQYVSAKAMAPQLASLGEQGVVVLPRPTTSDLSAAPELLQLAGDRLERHVGGRP